MPYIVGLVGVILFWVIVRVAAKSGTPSIITGEDGRPSTSKAQLIAWTCVVVFGYLAIYAVSARMGKFGRFPSIPKNLLIAMGISGVTAVGAKAIATNAADNAAAKAALAPPGLVLPPIPHLSGILVGDSGAPDIGKVQIVVWTLIALGIYVVLLIHTIHNGTPDLPDIDPTLMLLMGIGHSVYLGKKIAESQ